MNKKITQEEAMSYLEHMIVALQRYRSIGVEASGSLDVLGALFPWIYGDKCPLKALEQVTNRGSTTKMEFYNFMYILNRFMPEVAMAYEIVNPPVRFPEPDLSILDF